MKTRLTHQLDIREVQVLFTDARFAALFGTMDRLHDVVSEGQLAEVSPLSKADVLGWLRDIMYTVGETINELEDEAGDGANDAPSQPLKGRWDAKPGQTFIIDEQEGGCSA